MDAVERQAKIDFILEHYENPYRYGALEDATVVQKGGNPGCGDVVTMYLKVDEAGRITRHLVRGRRLHDQPGRRLDGDRDVRGQDA